MQRFTRTALLAALAMLGAMVQPAVAESGPVSGYDAALAERVGANDNGMRQYVLVILKTGPNRVPDGEERDAMFRGHFANMKRLAEAGQLAYAGPLDGADGWRGLFIIAVTDIETAKEIVATDPVIIKGEMVAEYHKHFGSAALMLVNEMTAKVAKTPMM